MKSEFGICMECGEEYRIMDRTVDDAIVVDGVCPNCSQDALDRARFNLGRSDGGWEGDE